MLGVFAHICGCGSMGGLHQKSGRNLTRCWEAQKAVIDRSKSSRRDARIHPRESRPQSRRHHIAGSDWLHLVKHDVFRVMG
jgi:hypothetical protein